MDNHTEEQRKRNMQAVKNKDTKIEIMLRKELWKRGARYRKNEKTIMGNPDIVFPKKKIAVFCDSEFWHGYEWEKNKETIHTRRDFWIPKIERNIERDKEVNQRLFEEGWLVIRFWGNDIIHNVQACADIVMKALENR